MDDKKIRSLDSLKFSDGVFPTQWWAKYLINPSDIFIPQYAEHDRKRYMKKYGHNIIYLLESETRFGQIYSCVKCNSIIKCARVIHPVWDDPSGIGGFGSVPFMESVPYCPRCEKVPNINGMQIRLNLAKSKVD